MARHIEYAFGADGQDFWEGFFPCNKAHPNEKIIYFFTEHQMWFFYNWWVEKYKKCGVNTRKNLDFSRQKLFRAVMSETGYEDRICACYVKKNGFNNHLILQRVLFGAHPGIIGKNYIDFFDGRFMEDQSAAFKDDERRDILTEILTMRPAIEKEFGGPGKNDVKWLRYLGPKVLESPSIEYCNKVNTCPFAGNNDF